MSDLTVVELEGTSLAVREWGEAEGVPLVFWHSLGPVVSGAMTEPPELREQNAEWAARFGAAVPQAEIRAVPDAGHSLLIDAGPELAEAIGRWLEAAT